MKLGETQLPIPALRSHLVWRHPYIVCVALMGALNLKWPWVTSSSGVWWKLSPSWEVGVEMKGLEQKLRRTWTFPMLSGHHCHKVMGRGGGGAGCLNRRSLEDWTKLIQFHLHSPHLPQEHLYPRGKQRWNSWVPVAWGGHWCSQGECWDCPGALARAPRLPIHCLLACHQGPP